MKLKKTSQVALPIFIFIFLIILIFLITLVINNYMKPESQKISKLIPNTEQDIINDCQNLGLFNATKCLTENIKTFFIYNDTEDKLELTFEDLKQRGGDCRDWSYFYSRLGNQLGFRNYTFRIEGDTESAHRFAVLESNDGFCIINFLSYKCFGYTPNNGEKKR